MIEKIFSCYRSDLDPELKNAYAEDFKIADKIVLAIVLSFCFFIAVLAPWQNGYFALGIGAGLGIAALSVITYLVIPGTFLSRNIMATALVAIMAVAIQQANGLGEGHFIFFISVVVLSRYRDIVPLLVVAGLTVLHHVSMSYCQNAGVTIAGNPIEVFSWGDSGDVPFLGPLMYHISVAVIAIAIAIFYAYEGTSRFLDSQALIAAIQDAAEGDLTRKISNNGKSAVIDQASGFLARLHEAFVKIDDVTQTVASLALTGVSSAQEKTRQAQLQQSEINHVANSVGEISTTTQQIAQNAEQSAEAAHLTVNISESGRRQAESFKNAMGELAKRANDATQIISNLDHGSQQISTIVGTIQGISEQTNLLALNAAIEAARAGEQGRGFAVVADEVRVLSQRTHDSTEEISRMIDSLQETTGLAVRTMGDFSELAERRLDEAASVQESFDKIASGIQELSSMAEQIATAAEEQSAVTKALYENANKVKNISLEFLQGSEDGEKQAAGLEVLAREMKSFLSYFKLA